MFCIAEICEAVHEQQEKYKMGVWRKKKSSNEIQNIKYQIFYTNWLRLIMNAHYMTAHGLSVWML